jgi:glycosyltransferase involved in cell wall biosynthesis
MSELYAVGIIAVNSNKERLLTAAIQSAHTQNHSHYQVIGVDDCSTDNSQAVISRYGNRSQIILKEQNGGLTVALNNAWSLGRLPAIPF